MADGERLKFKRSRFVARFPMDYLYSPSHFWLFEYEPGRWRVGLTDFATRMLGEIVEFDFESERGEALPAGARVRPGDVIGWMEGFKAVADVYCVADGVFLEANPRALEDPELVCKDCYGDGWLYAVEGRPDPGATGVKEYAELLNETIDTMEEKPWQSADMDPANPPATS